MRLRPRPRRRPHLDITPLVDVVFLLVIFFVVTTSFVRPGGLDLVLPQAETTMPLEEDRKVVVSIDADGVFFVDGQVHDTAALRRVLEAAHQADPRTVLLVQAHRQSRHQHVVTVLDLARMLSWRRIAIASENPDTP
ncbi:MAG: biopolymer transporter ExbD [Magnetococcus sp. WYHC-3]